MKRKRIVQGLTAAALLVGALVGCRYSHAAPGAAAEVAASVPAASAAHSATPGMAALTGGGFADVAERSVKSVVNVSSTKVIHLDQSGGFSPFFSDPFFRQFFGPRFHQQQPMEQRQKSLGSGVIVSDDGIILTNNHVVEKADEIRVTVPDHGHDKEYEVEVVGTDPKSDLAVLRLKGDVKGLKPLPIGSSSKLRLGEVVLAVGNPFGLSHTVTMGIVSAKGRANVGIVDYEDFIQTDAAINPGNSGGALVNLKGELVGINTAILSKSGGYQGIGFAIPSDMAKAVMNSLIEHGKVVRGWLGVAIQDTSEDLSKALGLPDARGVLISDVMDDSPAKRAGLQRGDVVLTLDGERMESTGQLRNKVAVLGAKAKARLEVLRDGKTLTIDVELGEQPDDMGQVGSTKPEEGALGGLTLGSLDPGSREHYKIPDRLEHGVVITAVEPGSPAGAAGLRPGDVLLELNRKGIDSVDDFIERYRKAKGRILLLLYRHGSTMFLVLNK